MMGRVDEDGRALVPIKLRAAQDSPAIEVDAWIDTGFTGELVLPAAIVEQLGLPQSGTLDAQLGDGTFTVLKTHPCFINLFGQEQSVEVVENAGSIPLLGVGLLRAHKLLVDFPAGTAAID